MSSVKKICVVGAHGTGKSKICEKILQKLEIIFDYDVKQYNKNEYAFRKDNMNLRNEYKRFDLCIIPEQFREVIKDIPNFTKQTEEITLATYGKQLYLENLYTLINNYFYH